MINMDIPSAVLKERAKATLRGTYWTFVGATLIVAIVSGLISGIAQLLGPAVGAVASIAVALFYIIPVGLGVQRMLSVPRRAAASTRMKSSTFTSPAIS